MWTCTQRPFKVARPSGTTTNCRPPLKLGLLLTPNRKNACLTPLQIRIPAPCQKTNRKFVIAYQPHWVGESLIRTKNILDSRRIRVSPAVRPHFRVCRSRLGVHCHSTCFRTDSRFLMLAAGPCLAGFPIQIVMRQIQYS